jgi:hypothetical protein
MRTTNKQHLNSAGNAKKRDKKRIAVWAVALVVAATALSSCDKDDPVTPPTPPSVPDTPVVELIDTARYENISDFLKFSFQIQNMDINSKKENYVVIISFEQNAKLVVFQTDFVVISTLDEVLKRSNVRFAANGAVLIPAADKIVLTDGECDVLSDLWVQGVQFGIGENGARFYINQAQEKKFPIDRQKKLLGWTDARPLVIQSEKDFGKNCAEAEELAKSGRVAVTLTGNWNMNADSLVHFRRILRHPNIFVTAASDAKITATVTRHPTEPYVLNSVDGYAGVPIDIVLDGENAKTADGAVIQTQILGGIPATVFNDSTFNYALTKATEAKQPGTYCLRFVDKNRTLTDPVVATYAESPKDSPNKSDDGSAAMPLDVIRLYYGCFGKENGSLVILSASGAIVNGGYDKYQLKPILGNKNFELWYSENPVFMNEFAYSYNYWNGGFSANEALCTAVDYNDIAYSKIHELLGLLQFDYKITIMNDNMKICFVSNYMLAGSLSEKERQPGIIQNLAYANWVVS